MTVNCYVGNEITCRDAETLPEKAFGTDRVIGQIIRDFSGLSSSEICKLKLQISEEDL